MKKIDLYTQEFKTKYESFITGCDAIEELGLWDKEAYGEMDVFYENDIISVIMKIIASDGMITARETEYLNKNFGFDFTTQRLADLYNNSKEELYDSFEAQFENGLNVMRSINEKLAAAYKDLLVLICDIIIESDGIISGDELAEAIKIRKLFSE